MGAGMVMSLALNAFRLEFELPFDHAPQELAHRGADCAFVVGILL